MGETRDVREIKADDTGEVFRWVNGVRDPEDADGLWRVKVVITPRGHHGEPNTHSALCRTLKVNVTEGVMLRLGLLDRVDRAREALAAMFRSEDTRPTPDPSLAFEVAEFLDFHASHRDLLQKFIGFWALSKERDGSEDSAREAWGRLKWWCNVDGNLKHGVLEDRYFQYYTALAIAARWPLFNGYCRGADYEIGVSPADLETLVDRDLRRRGYGAEKGGC